MYHTHIRIQPALKHPLRRRKDLVVPAYNAQIACISMFPVHMTIYSCPVMQVSVQLTVAKHTC